VRLTAKFGGIKKPTGSIFRSVFLLHIRIRMIRNNCTSCSILLQMINPQKLIVGGWIANNALFFHRLAAAINKAENNPDGCTPALSFHWKNYGAAMGAATLG